MYANDTAKVVWAAGTNAVATKLKEARPVPHFRYAGPPSRWPFPPALFSRHETRRGRR